jgi:nitroimidazol reductase NimA-like FMN-containing flavoprotein (pyridoxamine 5'-phosphate oxidase superfamily)
MSLSMSRAEREEFLAGLHVGVLSVASPDGRGPLTAPVWYTYQPGGTVNVSTGGSQVMIRLTPEHWLSRAYSDG